MATRFGKYGAARYVLEITLRADDSTDNGGGAVFPARLRCNNSAPVVAWADTECVRAGAPSAMEMVAARPPPLVLSGHATSLTPY